MPYNHAILLHYKVQLGDEVGIAPVMMKHIMLRAAGAVHVPEGVSGEPLHLTVILRLFQSDGHKHYIYYNKESLPPDEQRAGPRCHTMGICMMDTH